MSKKTIHLLKPDLCAHVYNRGVNREPIYLSPWYYDYFIGRLRRCIEKIPVKLLTFTLMPNHFHLIVQQSYPYSLSDFMKLLCDGFAKTFNLLLERKGHVFEGDYGLRPIETTEDLLYLTRYVHMNPVRAGLVKEAIDWQYSSARNFCGLGESSLVDPGIVLGQLGICSPETYRDYLREPAKHTDAWLDRYTFRKGRWGK